MPKSRLLNNSNNHFDDKELLIPNQNENNKKTGDSTTNYQQIKLPSTTTVDAKPITTPTTAVTRSNSRSIAKRPVSSTASSASNVKSTILSYEDRDIVIIDNVDYKESTSNEANVIVVEKPRKIINHQKPTGDIDLAELLESNWPATAGDLALALNNRTPTNGHNFSSGSTSTSNSSISCHQGINSFERNRSKNPFTHIGQSKIKRNTGNNINNFVTTGNLINLDSDGSSASGSFDSNPSKSIDFGFCLFFVYR